MDRYRHVPILAERLRDATSRDLPPVLGLGSAAGRNPSGTRSQEFGTPAIQGTVESVVYWHGSLVIGGSFSSIGGSPIRGVARWDGQSWQAVGRSYDVRALAVWRGQLVGSDGGSIEGWNGASWEPLTPYLSGWITTLTATDSALVFGGYFSVGNLYAPRIGRWDGTRMTWMGGTLDATPNTIVAFQGEWYAGGTPVMENAQDVLVRFDGSDWQSFGGLAYPTSVPTVLAMSVLDGELLVGGRFDSLGTLAASGLARWNGVTWAAVPGAGPYSTVYSMAVEGDSVVHMGGQLAGGYGLYRWNGAALASEPGPNPPLALASDGSRLAAAGPFDEAVDRVAFQVAERGPNGWHALEEWRAPMRGLAGPGTSMVRQFVSYDGGVVASGAFTAAANDTGWTRTRTVASWKNGAWHPMEGLYGNEDLVVHEGGLYAVADGARHWNGVGWDLLGGSVPGAGQGASANGTLYIGGSSSPSYFGGVWRWDDPAWTALPRPDGVPEIADALEMIADGANVVVSWTWPGGGRLTSWDGAAWTAISDVSALPIRVLGTWNGRLLAGSDGWQQPLMVREGGVWKSTGLTGSVTGLTTLGPWLVAAGRYLEGPGVRAAVAAWDGATWLVLPNRQYDVQAVLGDGQSLWSGAFAYGYGEDGAVARWDWDGRVPVVTVNSLAAATPNPFSTSVTLRFSLVRLGTTRLAIYDLAGHEVARLWNDVLGAGEHTLTWDGRDRQGNLAPAGIYFARLLLDDRSAQSQRIVLIR